MIKLIYERKFNKPTYVLGKEIVDGTVFLAGLDHSSAPTLICKISKDSFIWLSAYQNVGQPAANGGFEKSGLMSNSTEFYNFIPVDLEIKVITRSE